jgi:hypothetical protein
LTRNRYRQEACHAAGHHHRGACALEQPSGDEDAGPWCDGAQQRGSEQDDQPGDEDPAGAEVVDQDSGEQQQRCGGQEVAGHHPLDTGDGLTEVMRDDRNGDVHCDGVEGGDHRRQDRCSQQGDTGPTPEPDGEVGRHRPLGGWTAGPTREWSTPS